jgi:hypothetical protein
VRSGRLLMRNQPAGRCGRGRVRGSRTGSAGRRRRRSCGKA